MDKGDIEYDILKTELELTQRQIDKYDTISTTIKTWSISLWAASIGWAFQIHRRDIFLLGAVVVLLFWFFDAMNKTFRWGYKKRRGEIAEVLAEVFETGEVPAGTVSPKLPASTLEFFRNTFKVIFMVHISLPYMVLVVIAIVLFVKGGF
jgi:hypothetical protein